MCICKKGDDNSFGTLLATRNIHGYTMVCFLPEDLFYGYFALIL
uniref:Uncharacterized protein n=1 Tax=Arundo donax TaxID=35708 RepID=A0A0A9A7L3_ARUDO